MNRDELLNSLQSLHEQLAAAESVDQDTRQMLQTLTDDIQRVLEQQDDESAVAASDDDSLSDRLREAVIEFEVRHPQIGGMLERITDGLANLGI